MDNIVILRPYVYPAIHRSFLHRMVNFLSFMVSSFFTGLRVRDVDLVWGTSPPIFQAVTAWLLARLKAVPFLLEIRDLWPAFAIEVGVLRNRLLIRASEWLENFLYRHADQVVVNSPGFIQHVRARGASQVALVPNGVDVDPFTKAVPNPRFRLKLCLEDKFLILYAGAHGISNDLEIVLKAAHLLRDEKKIHLILVGDGKEKSSLQLQAAQMGLDNVLFLPPIPKNEMPALLASVDACIAILKPLDMYKTTYPNKVFDYMAAGKPVILAIDGVIRKVVEEAHAGLFVPPGDPHKLAEAARTFAADPNLTREMGEDGKRYVCRNFSRASLVEQFTLLVNLVLEKHGRKNPGRRG